MGPVQTLRFVYVKISIRSALNTPVIVRGMRCHGANAPLSGTHEQI